MVELVFLTFHCSVSNVQCSSFVTGWFLTHAASSSAEKRHSILEALGLETVSIFRNPK
jgi:hypothetical protein